MPICQMRLIAGSSVGKVVGRWACAGVLAARPTAVATAARAAERRMVEDMGGDEWVVVGAGMPQNAADDGGTRVAGQLARLSCFRYIFGIYCHSRCCPLPSVGECDRRPSSLP